MSELADAALVYASLGWYVFPLKPRGKTPLTEHGVKDATIEAATIATWWERWPTANIGLATGRSGVVAADLDIKHPPINGWESWRDLLAESHLTDPVTPICETPTGGGHVYFGTNGANVRASVGKLGPGIDIRAGESYVLLPPSIHPDTGTAYAWALGRSPYEIPVAPLPEALARKLTKPAHAPTDHPPVDVVRELPKAKAALEKLALHRCDNYGSWIEVGMALSELGAEGLALWDAWSRKSTKYREGVCAEKWESFTPGHGVTLASLYHWASEDTPDTDVRGDRGHSLVLAELWRDRYRWAIHRNTWMRWSGRVWEPVDDPEVATAGSDSLRWEYARRIATTGDKDALKRLAEQVTSLARVQAALVFLRGETGFATRAEQWDADAWALNVQNGVLDLHSGALRPHDPRELHSKIALVPYNPAVTSAAWEAHLQRFLRSPEVRRELKRQQGLSLVGTNLDELISIWYGIGGNAKSTTATVFQSCLGSYAQRAAPDLLVLSRHERHPTELAELYKARWVVSVEIKAGVQLDEGRVKTLTGGDPIRAHFMRCDNFEFAPTWTLALLVNHKPVIVGTDLAIWRRVRLIPWTETISPEERRPQAEVIAELLADGGAILTWMVQGLADWQLDHWWIAPEVQAASNAYRQEQDRLGGFLADCCDVGVHYAVGVGDLYTAYSGWCETNSEESLGKRDFGANLRDRGISQRREGHTRARRWVGVRLQTPRTTADNDSDTPLKEDESGKYTEGLSASVRRSSQPGGVG